MPVAISKLLEMIGRSSHFLVSARSTAFHLGMTQTAGTHNDLSMWKIDACMPQCVCCVQANRTPPATRRNRISSYRSILVGHRCPMSIKGLTFAGTRFFTTSVSSGGGGGKNHPQLISAPMIPRKKIQRLPPCFQGLGIQRSYSQYCVMQAEVRNPRWRLKKIRISQITIPALLLRLLCFQSPVIQ